MLATFESFDEMLAEAALHTTRSAALVGDNARRYMDDVSTANRNQMVALDAIQQAFTRSVFDVQTASYQISRIVLDTASQANRAFVRWAATAIWPWAPLGILTEAAPSTVRTAASPDTGDAEATRIGDYVISALNFQGPMGSISSGMAEGD